MMVFMFGSCFFCVYGGCGCGCVCGCVMVVCLFSVFDEGCGVDEPCFVVFGAV